MLGVIALTNDWGFKGPSPSYDELIGGVTVPGEEPQRGRKRSVDSRSVVWMQAVIFNRIKPLVPRMSSAFTWSACNSQYLTRLEPDAPRLYGLLLEPDYGITLLGPGGFTDRTECVLTCKITVYVMKFLTPSD